MNVFVRDHGPSRFQPDGRAQVGSGGGRVAALEWRTAGHRHHNGLPSKTGRHSAGQTGRLWTSREVRKRRDILNDQEKTAGPVWLSWERKLAADGQL